jgi:GNAT superfamily N-acetyltransferase
LRELAQGDLEKVVAFGVMRSDFYDNCFLDFLFVDENSRRQGRGRAMMEHMISLCATPKVFTSTKRSNTNCRPCSPSSGLPAAAKSIASMKATPSGFT